LYELVKSNGGSDIDAAISILAAGVGESVFKTIVPAGLLGKFINRKGTKFGSKGASKARSSTSAKAKSDK
jgi:hypothetical protein